MLYSVSIPASPVAAAFSGIKWDHIKNLVLTNSEKSLLRIGDENPIDYILFDRDDAQMYVRLLLKILSECSGPSGPSKKVSKLKETLNSHLAQQMLSIDCIGVLIHYIIYKLLEVISCLMERKEGSQVTMINIFYDSGELFHEWRPLLRMLHLGDGGDPYAQRGSALCLAYILFVGCPSQLSNTNGFTPDYSTVKEPLQALISWTTSQLQSSSGESVSLVTPTWMVLGRCIEARYMFANSGGIGYLSKHLRQKRGQDGIQKKHNGASVQQIYELTFILWTLTYEINSSYSVRVAFADMGAIRSLSDLISLAPREKVVRVALSALCNLAHCRPNDSDTSLVKRKLDGLYYLDEMIACGLLKSIDLLKHRTWADEDLLEDLKVISKLLHESYHEMSRWELYEHEVLSGELEWGVLHTEKFFSLNFKRFEGENSEFALLKKLIVLVSSDDEDVASVACFDIGEFARYYPNGRSILKRLGAKEVIMKLIEHENHQLQRHALQSMSKILVQNWASVK